jgi:ribonuclease Z
MLDICLLGCGGTQPLPGRRLSSALLRFGGNLTLIDCGEGTQVALRELGWGMRNLNLILLTHMHADHVLGIPGLLLTLSFSGKDASDRLTICGPEPLIDVIQGLMVVAPRLPYPLDLVVLEGGERFAPDGIEGLNVECAAAEHEIPCLAYAIAVPRAPRFDAARAMALGVPRSQWRTLQRGETVMVAGRAIEAHEVMGQPRKGIRIVYTTDTRPAATVLDLVRGEGRGADLLIADAMYATDEDKPKRWDAQHLTFAEAATLARDGGARQLWLTHFGPALTDPLSYVQHASDIFPHTSVGVDGLTTTLKFAQE